jgi:hypothetical protein
MQGDDVCVEPAVMSRSGAGRWPGKLVNRSRACLLRLRSGDVESGCMDLHVRPK